MKIKCNLLCKVKRRRRHFGLPSDRGPGACALRVLKEKKELFGNTFTLWAASRRPSNRYLFSCTTDMYEISNSAYIWAAFVYNKAKTHGSYTNLFESLFTERLCKPFRSHRARLKDMVAAQIPHILRMRFAQCSLHLYFGNSKDGRRQYCKNVKNAFYVPVRPPTAFSYHCRPFPFTTSVLSTALI
ncbi:hypothetical protein EVAR_49390_1 [Eumeta japonica]|uniref:Uncharacterized protein n=1 Tax=Eumeta variegata TaxID=151549 RepID=A0A4C1YL80_EUMVA|nr:hypothetical protein EVAR_49390_1 [Eumeta japonica]